MHAVLGHLMTQDDAEKGHSIRAERRLLNCRPAIFTPRSRRARTWRLGWVGRTTSHGPTCWWAPVSANRIFIYRWAGVHHIRNANRYKSILRPATDASRMPHRIHLARPHHRRLMRGKACNPCKSDQTVAETFRRQVSFGPPNLRPAHLRYLQQPALACIHPRQPTPASGENWKEVPSPPPLHQSPPLSGGFLFLAKKPLFRRFSAFAPCRHDHVFGPSLAKFLSLSAVFLRL
jgi:hypothetical protein